MESSVIKGNENSLPVWYPKLYEDESVQNYDFTGFLYSYETWCSALKECSVF
jgi:hypothetical protein